MASGAASIEDNGRRIDVLNTTALGLAVSASGGAAIRAAA
jgi:hypothetical protein